MTRNAVSLQGFASLELVLVHPLILFLEDNGKAMHLQSFLCSIHNRRFSILTPKLNSIMDFDKSYYVLRNVLDGKTHMVPKKKKEILNLLGGTRRAIARGTEGSRRKTIQW